MATMTPQEVAIRCNIDERTVYRWIKNGQLDATKVGSRWRVRLPLPEEGLGEDGGMDDPSTASTPEASSGLGRKLPQAALVRRNDNLIQLATEMAQSAANLPAEELKRHWDILLAVMRPLEGVKILPLEGRHLLPWWENPVGPHRLGALAFVSWGEDGALSVVMSAEITNPVEWGYLQQHLARHPVWDAIESWKSVMARDLEARIARFDELWRRAEEAKSEGGEKLCLTVHYVEALYDQVICRVSGKPVTPKRREDTSGLVWRGRCS